MSELLDAVILGLQLCPSQNMQPQFIEFAKIKRQT